MGTAGVDGMQTQTNHVMETWSALGIEAARRKIIEQIVYVMSQHGMTIDGRHTMLLADCMTYKVGVQPRSTAQRSRADGPAGAAGLCLAVR
jgi:DNA-directed RNA polymerase beta' subunit